MALPAARLSLELVPHCASVTRDGWTESHDVRPLTELGFRQAVALAEAIGAEADGIYSSPTVRCRQTVASLASAAGLPVQDLAELYEAGGFDEPTAGTSAGPEIMAPAIGGAWAGGRMLRAVSVMMQAHPGGRVIAASHGDAIPVLLAALSGAFAAAYQPWVGRGGWYTLQFAPGELAITPRPAALLRRVTPRAKRPPGPQREMSVSSALGRQPRFPEHVVACRFTVFGTASKPSNAGLVQRCRRLFTAQGHRQGRACGASTFRIADFWAVILIANPLELSGWTDQCEATP